MKSISLNNFLDSDHYVHIARNTRQLGGVHGAPLHSHDFPEVFWIERGQCTHRVNGHTYPLTKGDLIFIRPADIHAIQLKKGRDLSYINLAFRKEHIDEFIGRLAPDIPTFWEERAAFPATVRLSDSMLTELAHAVETLLQTTRSRLMMEWMLCELFRIIGPVTREHSDIPQWLRSALTRIRQPEYFTRGAKGLAELSGRTPEHVSRVTKLTLGKTPSQIVNGARIEYAANQLIMTDDDINALALETGFLSLGQFYSVFKETFSMTPRRYRLHHSRIN